MKIALSVITALLFLGCSSDDITQVKEDVKAVEVEDIKEKIETTKETIQEKTSDVVSSVKDSTSYVVESVLPEKIDAALLYSSCAGCHGTNGEKLALGKSKAIQGWDAQRTIDALNGYSDGSYGGALKGMMKSQADKLSVKETEAIAKYISKL